MSESKEETEEVEVEVEGGVCEGQRCHTPQAEFGLAGVITGAESECGCIHKN